MRFSTTAILSKLKRQLSTRLSFKGRDDLLFQRLVLGALAGSLATLLIAESPVLDMLELGMLSWHYRIANQVSAWLSPALKSRDIRLVTYDDNDQFDLGQASFTEKSSQEVLAQALEVIEKSSPALIVVDLDLRGAASTKLVELMSRYRNVVVAVFGDLSKSEDWPALEVRTRAAACGYDELPREANGMVARLPIEYHAEGQDKPTAEKPSAEGQPQTLQTPFKSLTEATVSAYRYITGIGPSKQFFAMWSKEPMYINFRRIDYDPHRLGQVLNPDFNGEHFRDRIVIIGSDFAHKNDDPTDVTTPTGKKISDVKVHAEAISTLLDNEVIYSFPRALAHHFLIILGAILGALASISPMGIRLALIAGSSVFIVCATQTSFQFGHLQIPSVPLLAVNAAAFILGTVIHLDTDLRQRNRELAKAREAMQVRAEEERQRIAEDLHDETLPALSEVARMADRLTVELKDNPVPTRMRENLDRAVQEMRRVINDLHPSVLETMGFKPALENLLSILTRRQHVEAIFLDGDGKDDYNLSTFHELQLYRIVQEALNNVEKHAKASQVELTVRQEGEYLEIVIADNGTGIDPKVARRDSRGLLNIRQRAQLIGAQVSWKKPLKFSSGTELKLRMPIFEVQEADTGEIS